MGLSDLRRWHWMVIGVLLGLIIAYSLNSIGIDALITGDRSAKTSQTSFEEELVNWQGQFPPSVNPDGTTNPRLRNIVVYPDGPINLIRMQRLINLEPNLGNDSRNWQYQTWYFEARKPYSPLLQGDMRTDVRIKPDFPPDYSLDGHPAYVTNQAWRDADGVGKKYRDPGDGVEIFPNIAKGNYNAVFRLDNAQQAADLTIKFNGHLLAPLAVDPTDPHNFQTTIPAADFDAKAGRSLSLAHKDAPVPISQIHIYNPTYTVRDYLDTLQAQHPEMQHYHYAWWWEPTSVRWLAVGICFVLIGVIWPTVIGLLTGAGFGPPPREKGVSLRNLKATPAPLAAVAAAPTDEDLASLQQMEEDLLKELESESPARPSEGQPAPTTPPPLKALDAKPLEPSQVSVPRKDEDPKTFAGEYYPVARKAGSDEKKDG